MKYQPRSSSLFTGRQDFLNALEEFFTDQGPRQHLRREYLLFGMGGAGKTQIALKFAESHQQQQVHMHFFIYLL
jgi:Holliday junction resolvasome RuvABC ATP-dependent DNA helicase subunit